MSTCWIDPLSAMPQKSHFLTTQTRTTTFMSCRFNSESGVNSIEKILQIKKRNGK
jgi:hypothetical protein